MIILGIETSCDETAVAVLEDGRFILADLLSSQIDLHEKYGGVVPELACRRHVEVIDPLIREAVKKSGRTLRQVDAVAVTVGPGLIGALLVGVSIAKSLSYALGVPLLPVHHLEGHIAASFIENHDVRFPSVALIVSGGHTNLYYMARKGAYRLLGKTIDDAAGEALDKGARLLGYGYPGGPIIDRLAQKGDPEKIRFPVPYRSSVHYDFSFSGLKTALNQRFSEEVHKSKGNISLIQDIAAGYQAAVVESLVEKTFSAVEKEGAKGVLLGGGVAANTLLRRRIKEKADRLGIATYIPSPSYCTDNGVMIAMAGVSHYERGRYASIDLTPVANMELSE
ncbi:MAG: tRNA (adenosine(37)-N6)-threonylcarbamoyltransferase complex transferase subunit TsaD [Nitrospiria bacterium]